MRKKLVIAVGGTFAAGALVGAAFLHPFGADASSQGARGDGAGRHAAGPLGHGHEAREGHEGHEGHGPMGDHDRGGPHGPMRDRLAVAAQTLGIEEATLLQQLRDGTTLADIAKANDVKVATLVDALVADATEHLTEAVTDGRLTQDQADRMAKDLRDHITSEVNGTDDHGPMGRGPMGDFGPHGPHGPMGPGPMGDGPMGDGPDGASGTTADPTSA